MTPMEKAELALGAIRFGKLLASQLSLAEMDELTPERRAALKVERDEVNARLDSVTPKSGS